MKFYLLVFDTILGLEFNFELNVCQRTLRHHLLSSTAMALVRKYTKIYLLSLFHCLSGSVLLSAPTEIDGCIPAI